MPKHFSIAQALLCVFGTAATATRQDGKLERRSYIDLTSSTYVQTLSAWTNSSTISSPSTVASYSSLSTTPHNHSPTSDRPVPYPEPTTTSITPPASKTYKGTGNTNYLTSSHEGESCEPSSTGVLYVTETKTETLPYIISLGHENTAAAVSTTAPPDVVLPPPLCSTVPLIATNKYPTPAPYTYTDNPDRTFNSFLVSSTSTRYATTFKTSMPVADNTGPAIKYPGHAPDATGEARAPPLETSKGNIPQPLNGDGGGSGAPEPEHSTSPQKPGPSQPETHQHEASGTPPQSGQSSPGSQEDTNGSGANGQGSPSMVSSPQQQQQGSGTANPPSYGNSGSPGPIKGHLPGAVVNHVLIAADQGQVAIGSKTFSADSSRNNVQIIDGQTFTILPSNGGVIAPGGMTISAAPGATVTSDPIVTMAGVPIAGVPSQPTKVIAGGSSLQLPSAGKSVVTVLGQTFTLEPSAIINGDSTVNIPSALAASLPQFTAETISDVPFDIGSSVAVIDGKTVAIGSGAIPSTFIVSGKTIIADINGLQFPGQSTTVAPLPESSIVTAEGATFSVEPSAVVIGGTTYSFSHPTQVVIGTNTFSVGTDGVIMSSTTVHPMSITKSSALVSTTASVSLSKTRSEVSKKEGSATSGASAASASPTNAASRLDAFAGLWPASLGAIFAVIAL